MEEESIENAPHMSTINAARASRHSTHPLNCFPSQKTISHLLRWHWFSSVTLMHPHHIVFTAIGRHNGRWVDGNHVRYVEYYYVTRDIFVRNEYEAVSSIAVHRDRILSSIEHTMQWAQTSITKNLISFIINWEWFYYGGKSLHSRSIVRSLYTISYWTACQMSHMNRARHTQFAWMWLVRMKPHFAWECNNLHVKNMISECAIGKCHMVIGRWGMAFASTVYLCHYYSWLCFCE